MNNIEVHFSTAVGIVDSDVTGGELWRDVNNNGLIDGADVPLQVGVNGSGGILAFSGIFEDPGFGGRQYVIRATVANLLAGDSTTFSLDLSDIDQFETGITESGAVSGVVHAQDTWSSGNVFYSVGTETANLMIGSPLITILGGDATLDIAQTGNIGVGDEIVYGAGAKAYIKSVISPSQFEVHDPRGGAPPNATNLTVIAIRRAFNDLLTAIFNSGNANHIADFNLTPSGAGVNLTWVCYNDNNVPIDIGASNNPIDGYLTDPGHRITLTAAAGPQVVSGVSQRHTGIAGTGARLRATGSDGPMLIVNDDYVTVEWLELDGNRDSSVDRRYGVRIEGSVTGITVRNLIVHDLQSGGGASGIALWQSDKVRIYNNFIYDIVSSSPVAAQDAANGIVEETGSATDIAIYNNTVFKVRHSQLTSSANAYGIAVKDLSDRFIENNIVLDVQVAGGGNARAYCVFTGTFNGTELCHTNTPPPAAATLQYNMSSDDTAVGPGSIINESSGELINTADGTEDLHLVPGADASDVGTSLYGEFSNDIDGEPRFAPWDMGADEGRSSDFACARTITIDHTKVGLDDNPGALTDFPVLLDITDVDLRTVPNGGNVQSANGYDIVFLSSDGITRLDHEIEQYDPVGGRLIAWVRVPTVRKDVDTVVHMLLGSACVTSSQENTPGVWNTNFKGVWHVDDDFLDSTTYNNDGTNLGSTDAPGQISNGQVFDGINDSIDLNNAGNSLNVGQDFTISAWVKRSSFGVAHTILTKRTGLYYSWSLALNPLDQIELYAGDSIPLFDNVKAFTVVDSNWHHIVGRSNGSELKLFLDGVKHINTGAVTLSYDYDTTSLVAGVKQWFGSPVDYLHGSLDEIRVSNVALSDDWIATEYNNQANPGTFASLGTSVALTLSDHDAGQVGDHFVGLTPVTDTLFAFNLQGSAAATVDSLRVQFTTANGVVSADVSNGELWRDNNNDGLINGGDAPIEVGVAPSGDTLLFTSNFPLVVGGANYLVRATVGNLVLNDTTTFSLAVEDVETVEVSICYSGSTTGAVHFQDAAPTLTLANHDSGQIPDQFLTSSTVFSELFAFKLTSSGAGTVSAIRVRFTTGGGVLNGDVSSGQLYRDNNDDGVIDGGDFLIQGGVTPVGGVLSFTGLGETPVGTIQYLVRANVLNLVAGDTTTFSLALSDIDELEAGVVELGGTSDAVHTQDSALGGDVYYSVGTDASDLKTGTPTIDIINGTAFLSVPQTGNIGVGDEIDYGGGIKAHIKDVVSPSQFVVHRPDGSAPGNVSALPVNSIRRAFNNLAVAISNSGDTAHLNDPLWPGGTSLVLADVNLTWVCYNDTNPLTVGASQTITINNYTTDANHTLTLTAARASQVVSGNSQRHTGVAGSGARLVATGNGGPMLRVAVGYVTVEWLELDGDRPSFLRTQGVRVESSTNNIVIRDLIVHDIEDAGGASGIRIQQVDPIYVYNNIVYDIVSFGNTAYGIADGNAGSPAGVFVYNNTVFNVRQTDTGSTANAYGIALVDLDDREVENNIVIGAATVGTGSAQDYCLYSGVLGTSETCHTSGTPPVTASFHHNMSSDDTAVDNPPGSTSITLENSGEFVSAIDNSEDMHLVPTANAVDAGMNLSIFFTGDIDGGLRADPWDMGADDLQAATAVELVSFEARAGDAAMELTWETGSEVDNVGFYLYRGLSADGPFELVNESVIPGLGSSP
ncbi:MAG: LamG-like jellyroll fold domain-containing protein, partial [Vicinamibacteria bacterium]